MWINKGIYKNKQVVPRDFIKRSLESHFVVDGGINDQYPDEHFTNVGFCWFLSSYRGHYRAHHTGNIDGFSSSISYYPYDSLGVVVLTNQNGSTLIRLVPEFVSDIVFDLPLRDKNSALIERRNKRVSTTKRPEWIDIDTLSIKPRFSTAKYTGRFENAGYGETMISEHKKALLMTYYDLKLLLIPKGGNLFSSHYCREEGVSPNGVGDILFKFDSNSVLQSFQIPFEPTVKDIIFRKK